MIFSPLDVYALNDFSAGFKSYGQPFRNFQPVPIPRVAPDERAAFTGLESPEPVDGHFAPAILEMACDKIHQGFDYIHRGFPRLNARVAFQLFRQFKFR
jgi:hypothetical protein